MMRFVYEEAENMLDSYALGRRESGDKQFYRAYRKFRCLITIYAYMDFPSGSAPKQRLSWAWEDVDIAFRGYGDNILTGVMLQMWDHTADEEEANRFHRTITKALERSNAVTDKNCPRRYLIKWRQSRVRKGADDFADQVVLPVNGPKLREWAEAEGFDAESIEHQFGLLEAAQREVFGLAGGDEKEGEVKPGLRLLPGGKK
jgi:hypothetical protein